MESVAHLIKLWFRELPQPILAESMYAVADGEVTDEASCERCLATVPEQNRAVINWLMQLVCDICRRAPASHGGACASCVLCAMRTRA